MLRIATELSRSERAESTIVKIHRALAKASFAVRKILLEVTVVPDPSISPDAQPLGPS
jgi:hypothetical protein